MLAFIALSLLVLLVQDIPLGAYLRQVQTDRIVATLKQDAFVLAGHAQPPLQNSKANDTVALTKLTKAYRDAGGARVVIVDATGMAIVTNDDDQSSVGASYSSRPEIAAALGGSIESGSRYSQTLGVTLLYVTVPVLNGPDVIGAVRLTYPEQVVTDAVNGQLAVLGLVALTTVLLAAIVGYIFSSGFTRRLILLERTTETLARGHLHRRADETSGAPEIRSLSRSFNTMAERLESMIAQQRSFAADASHQLRTPLTALRLRLESARALVTTDPAAAELRLAAAETEADRLMRIIEGLLVLSRAESASEREPLDVAAIARERVEQWQALAQELGVQLSFDGPDTAPALAVPTAVEQVIDNYVDNALSVSPWGSDLIVRVVAEERRVVISVLDSGPGLSEEDRERAFSRFWRARADNSGSGLGLAIVRQLVTASGGQVRLEARPGGGLAAVAVFDTA
jgi:signal transduction histidine kinase